MPAHALSCGAATTTATCHVFLQYRLKIVKILKHRVHQTKGLVPRVPLKCEKHHYWYSYYKKIQLRKAHPRPLLLDVFVLMHLFPYTCPIQHSILVLLRMSSLCPYHACCNRLQEWKMTIVLLLLLLFLNISFDSPLILSGKYVFESPIQCDFLSDLIIYV